MMFADPGFFETVLIGPSQDLQVPFMAFAQATLRRVRRHQEEANVHFASPALHKS
jgi:hypothetical protein